MDEERIMETEEQNLDEEISAIYSDEEIEEHSDDVGETSADEMDENGEDESGEDDIEEASDEEDDSDDDEDDEDDMAEDGEVSPSDTEEDESEDDESEDDDTDNAQPKEQVFVTISYGDSSARIPADVVDSISSQLGVELNSLVASAYEYQQYSPALSVLQDIAAQNNTDISGVAQLLDKQLYDSLLDPIRDKLREKYSHSDPAFLDDMAQREADKRIAELREKRKALNIPDANKAHENRMVQRWRQAFSMFSGLEPKTIPKSVYEACGNGADPVEAMYQYEAEKASKEIEKLKHDLKVAKKNLKNAKRSVGPMHGSLDTKTIEDEIDEIYRS